MNEVRVDGRDRYLVRCICGYEGIRRKDHVESGRTVSCKVCSTKNTHANFPNPLFAKRPHQGEGDLSKTLWMHIKSGAERRNIPFFITLKFAWSLFEKQEAHCALSGCPITLSPKLKRANPDYGAFTASLDRIDSDGPYSEANVQWVHREVNFLKKDMDQRQFTAWCCLIAAHQSSSA